ncbi:UNVERIFIED_CONTAM: hypothetical protein GTU68_010517 [Idotea baltica]|nr:hypothetical protein [Idotea baltica]
MTGLDAHLVVRRSDGFALDARFAIAPGETLALLGPNGAGKSTTVDALAGLTPLDDGHVAENRRIGVVFQDYLLFDHMSVFENVMFGPVSIGEPKPAAQARVATLLDQLALREFADRRPPQLSGGQAQRVALARALATEPDLLLLDEALAALDVSTRGSLRRVLARHLADFEGPRLLITHDPTDAFLLADRIAIIEDGTLSQVGSAEDIRRRPATPYVAALAGTNLLIGTNRSGLLTLDTHDHDLQTADTSIDGPVLITIHPTAIALHRQQPTGSPRNTWQTTVDSVEPLGDTTRITLAGPIPLGVDITPGATAALDLQPRSAVWASVKATEIMVTPAAPPATDSLGAHG